MADINDKKVINDGLMVNEDFEIPVDDSLVQNESIFLTEDEIIRRKNKQLFENVLKNK